MQEMHVNVWIDPLVEARGFHITDQYCETYWLPILGPSALWMARRLVAIAPGKISLEDLAGCLGLGRGLGHNGTLHRTIKRLDNFGVAQLRTITKDEDVFVYVRTHLDYVSVRSINRLPLPLQTAHQIEKMGNALRDARERTAHEVA